MPTGDELHVRTLIEAVNSTSRLLGLDDNTYNGDPVLTGDKAEEARIVVRVWFDDNEPGTTYPVLHEPGHEGAMWVLSLEGIGDWAVRIGQDESVTWPPGVFAEPVADWCLGLYPA